MGVSWKQDAGPCWARGGWRIRLQPAANVQPRSDPVHTAQGAQRHTRETPREVERVSGATGAKDGGWDRLPARVSNLAVSQGIFCP